MISPEEALHLVLAYAEVRPSAELPVMKAMGMVLAEPITVDRDNPPFPRAMMDGYAVPFGAEGKSLAVVGEAMAGHDRDITVTDNSCVEIMTGACCPIGAYAVVAREDAHPGASGIRMPGHILAGQNIASPGSECHTGEVVLRPGDRVTPLAVGVLASLGKMTVRVIRPVRLAIVTTGSELITANEVPAGTRIRDSNGPMLWAMARVAGVARTRSIHAKDDRESIVETLQRTVDRDIVLMSGGVSAGRYDCVPAALAEVGAEVIFHKVSQKPGKPLLFARRGQQLIFGLPGNPLSCHFCFHRYAAPAIRTMQGMPPSGTAIIAQLAGPLQSEPDRAYFVPGWLENRFPEDRVLRVHPRPARSSADIFHPCQANCYIELAPGGSEVPAGCRVSVTPLNAANC
jgi:molybdopterin molybdotransferase